MGEIVIKPIGNNGMMQGYDLTLLASIKLSAKVPIIVLENSWEAQEVRMLDVYKKMLGS